MSEIQANKLSPASGTALQVGDSGDTITIPSGATITNSGTANGFGENNTPSWLVRYNGEQSLGDYTTTKVTWNIEEIDTDNAFASDKFTVPSGGAGKYYIFTALHNKGTNFSSVIKTDLKIYKNGSSVAFAAQDFRNNYTNQTGSTISTILDLSVSDYIEVCTAVDIDSGTPYYEGNNYRGIFGGFKITT